jgi:hypothetical protein
MLKADAASFDSLMHRRPLARLLDPETHIFANPAQFALQWDAN